MSLVHHMEKSRREEIRWHLLSIANLQRPEGVQSRAMLGVVKAAFEDASELEIRRELDYLEERKLVQITKDPLGYWKVELTRHGIDFVEYTIEAQPGIARPKVGGA
jgi:hypothetical protein